MSRALKRPWGPPPEDDERFRTLYDHTSKDLLAYLLRRCASAEDAADCLAETYRIAWEKRTQISTKDARPWLFGIARNVSLRQRITDQQHAAAATQLSTAVANASPLAAPQHEAVTAALSELSSLDRDIVLMLSAGGLAPREVAAVVALSPNAVRVRAHRAREKLRALLTPDPTDEDTEPANPLSTAANGQP